MLKKPIVRSLFWSYSNIFISGLITFSLILVISRFIDLKEYGIFSMYLLVINFLSTISEFGASSFLLKEKSINSNVFSNSIFLVSFVSFLLILILNTLPFVYIPLKIFVDLHPFFRLLPSVILSNNLINLINATFLRSLKNRTISNISIFCSFISLIICFIILPYYGGLNSLLIFILLKSWFILFLSIIYLEIRLSHIVDIKVIKDIIYFGFPLISSRIVDKFNDQAPKVFTGLYLGTYELGVISAAYLVVNSVHVIFKSTIQTLWIPILSKILIELPHRFGEIFLRIRNIILAITTPIFLSIIIMNDKFVKILLPDKFNNIIEILPILSLLGIFVSLHYLVKPAFVVLSKTRKRFDISILRLSFGLILFPIFSKDGLNALLYTTLFLEIIMMLFGNYSISKYIKIGLKEQFITIIKIIFPLIAMYSLGIILNFYFENISTTFSILLNLSFLISTYILSIYFLNKDLLIEFKKLFKILINQNSIVKTF